MKEPGAVIEARKFLSNPIYAQSSKAEIALANLVIKNLLALRELEAKEPVITLEISNEGMGDFWLESFNGGPLPQDEQFEGTYRRIRGEE